MTRRIKNWTKFQHFKDRRPPWVKLYRDLLDDMEWHLLEPKAAKTLVMLWLIASEEDGKLPEAKTLAFRLRTTEKEIISILQGLSHWLEQDDINVISERYQDDAPEKSRDRVRDRDTLVRDFDQFYAAYPKKKSRGDAEKAFAKVHGSVPLETLLTAISTLSESPDWRRDDGRYIPYPASWLNAKGWLDVEDVKTSRASSMGLFV